VAAGSERRQLARSADSSRSPDKASHSESSERSRRSRSTSALYLAAFRILTPASIRTCQLLSGAVLGGVGYSILLLTGTAFVQHQLRHAQALYGQFAVVLGLMGWLYV
jgi:hypothetical protein